MAQDGKTVVADAAGSPAPRLLFSSYHCYLDPSSGAAIATRDLLELLASHGWAGKGDRHLLCEAPDGPFRQKVPVTFSGPGWDVRVFCGPRLDFERRESLAQLLSDHGIAFEERRFRQGGTPSPPAPLPQTGEGSSVASAALPRTGEGSPHPDPLPKAALSQKGLG